MADETDPSVRTLASGVLGERALSGTTGLSFVADDRSRSPCIGGPFTFVTGDLAGGVAGPDPLTEEGVLLVEERLTAASAATAFTPGLLVCAAGVAGEAASLNSFLMNFGVPFGVCTLA